MFFGMRQCFADAGKVVHKELDAFFFKKIFSVFHVQPGIFNAEIPHDKGKLMLGDRMVRKAYAHFSGIAACKGILQQKHYLADGLPCPDTGQPKGINNGAERNILVVQRRQHGGIALPELFA